MTREQLPEGLQLLWEGFANFVRSEDLVELAMGIEKHGAWEWSAGFPGRAFDMSVSLTAVPEAAYLGEPATYTCELWIEGEGQGRVYRRQVAAFKLAENTIRSQGSEVALQALNDRLSSLIESVTSIGPRDLSGPDSFPRLSRSR